MLSVCFDVEHVPGIATMVYQEISVRADHLSGRGYRSQPKEERLERSADAGAGRSRSTHASQFFWQLLLLHRSCSQLHDRPSVGCRALAAVAVPAIDLSVLYLALRTFY